MQRNFIDQIVSLQLPSSKLKIIINTCLSKDKKYEALKY